MPLLYDVNSLLQMNKTQRKERKEGVWEIIHWLSNGNMHTITDFAFVYMAPGQTKSHSHTCFQRARKCIFPCLKEGHASKHLSTTTANAMLLNMSPKAYQLET